MPGSRPAGWALALAVVVPIAFCGGVSADRHMSQEEYACSDLIHGFPKVECWAKEIVGKVPSLIDVPPGMPRADLIVLYPWSSRPALFRGANRG